MSEHECDQFPGDMLVPAADHRRQRALNHGHLTDPDKEPTMAAVGFFSSRQMSTTICLKALTAVLRRYSLGCLLHCR